MKKKYTDLHALLLIFTAFAMGWIVGNGKPDKDPKDLDCLNSPHSKECVENLPKN